MKYKILLALLFALGSVAWAQDPQSQAPAPSPSSGFRGSRRGLQCVLACDVQMRWKGSPLRSQAADAGVTVQPPCSWLTIEESLTIT